MKLKQLLILLICVSPTGLLAQVWQPKKAALMTKYVKDVNPAHVLPEYPRPQMVRAQWLNLNGLWQFQPGASGETLPKGTLAKTILVPFPVESALSGVMEHHERLWYRKVFTVPANWKGKNLLLHFGAVDFEAQVFVNGKSLGAHRGGYDPFDYDITSALKPGSQQEITVRVYDPTDNGGFPRGKQTLKPQGIMYTSVTGIWQTVWVEPVAKTSIATIKLTPDIDKSVIKLTVNTDGNAGNSSVAVNIKDGGKIIKTITIKPNVETNIPVANAKLWSPDKPFLYDLAIALKKNGATVDEVSSYFGMRKISVANEGGFKKLYLNNKFLFQLGPLDQGFWPDGGYTAPTDEALKFDLVMIKKFGFNMVRKHIKVEPYRWYYWADKLGILVWQDMPSANSYTEHTPPVDTVEFRAELARIVKTHWNSPSIVTWDIFNEAQGQNNTQSLVKMVRLLDPSRLINQASGGDYFGVGDFLDIHSYPPPAVPYSTKQVLACGEYGGIGYIVPNHIWGQQPTYVMTNTQKEYLDLYDSFANDLTIYKTSMGLSAAVYTEITDVEAELNGLLTYDRAVDKGGAAAIAAANHKVIHDQLYLTELLHTSQKEGQSWKYTLDKPDTTWYADNYNDTGWKSGLAGFGTKGTSGGTVRTVWDTKDIWIRKDFAFNNLSEVDKNKLILYIDHDDNCEVYINGVKAAIADGYTAAYSIVALSKEAKNALHTNGRNVIAIHCKQISGGQFIDAGIALMSSKRP